MKCERIRPYLGTSHLKNLFCLICLLLSVFVLADTNLSVSQQLDRLIEKSDFSSDEFFNHYQQLKERYPEHPSLENKAKRAIIDSAIALNAHSTEQYPEVMRQITELIPHITDEDLVFSLKSQLFFMGSFDNDNIAYYQQVKKLIEQAPANTTSTSYGYLLLDAANIALRLMQDEEGWHYFSLAHQFATKIDDKDFWSSVENSRGLALSEHGHFQKALTAFKKALAYKKELGVNHAVVYANIAFNFFNLKQLDETMEYASRALGQANVEQNRYVEVLIKTLLGRVAKSKGEYQQSVDWFSQSLTLAQEDDIRDYIFAGYADSIYPLLHLGRIDQAMMHLVQAKAIAEKEKLNVESYLYELEAVIKHHQHAYDQSMDLFFQAISAIVKNYNLSSAKIAEQSRALMETQVQELENKRLRAQNEAKQGFLDEISEKNRWLSWLALIITFCLLILIVLIFYVRRIAKKHQLHATTDELTHIPNRRSALSRLKKKMFTAKKSAKPLVIGMLDIDYFKKINDQYGHLVGDTVLIEVAKVCQQCLVSPDFIGRLGGEEFLIVLSNVDESSALEKMERIRTVIEQLHFEAPELANLTVSASFGVTMLLDSDRQIEQLIHRADIALYYAKEHGRNQIQLFSATMLD